MSALRDQLDQIARLEEIALDAEAHYARYSYEDRDAMRAHQVAWQHLTQALVNFWRSSGRSLALKGLQAEAMREAIGNAARNIREAAVGKPSGQAARLHAIAKYLEGILKKADLEQALNERKET